MAFRIEGVCIIRKCTGKDTDTARHVSIDFDIDMDVDLDIDICIDIDVDADVDIDRDFFRTSLEAL